MPRFVIVASSALFFNFRNLKVMPVGVVGPDRSAPETWACIVAQLLLVLLVLVLWTVTEGAPYRKYMYKDRKPMSRDLAAEMCPCGRYRLERMSRSDRYRDTCSSCRKAKQREQRVVSAARQQAASWSTNGTASSHQQCTGDAEPWWYRVDGPYAGYAVDPYDRCAGRDWEEDLPGSAGQTDWDAPVSRPESAAPLATWLENLHGCGDVWPNAWGREDCSRASAESHEPLPQPSVHDAEGDAWQGQDSEMPPTNVDTATDEQPEA